MKVSFTGAPEWMDRRVGFGEASVQIFKSLKDFDIECLVKSKEPNIGISFTQPVNYSFAKNQYRIGYTPWESTDIFPTWKDPLNNQIDEFWATSQWCADIFSKHTNKPIFIYEHGIDDNWIPLKRFSPKSRPFRFLHIGEPANRKDAQMVLDTFIKIFGDNPNVELIFKCSNLSTIKVIDPITKKVVGSPNAFYKNIKIIESYLSVEQMNGLYDLCDVFVYPSWGEGFGFNPLQSMAKGIPTICTSVWASYAKYITMPLNSIEFPSPWQHTHPGNMFKPDSTHLEFYMQDVFDQYEKYCDIAYKNAFFIHKDYNWSKVSKPAAERLKNIQNSYF